MDDSTMLVDGQRIDIRLIHQAYNPLASGVYEHPVNMLVIDIISSQQRKNEEFNPLDRNVILAVDLW